MRPELAAVAAQQCGVFSRAQATAAGYARSTVARRLANGEWVRVMRDVFRHAATPSSDLALAHAALLQTGPHAVLSHATAALVLHLPGAWPTRPIEVTVPRDCRVKDPLLRLHRTATAPATILYDGLSVTSRTRTTIDLALPLGRGERATLFDGVLQQRRVSVKTLDDEAALAKGRRGARGLLRDVAAVRPDQQSIAERALAEALRANGVPPGIGQHTIRDATGFVGRVDRAWLEQRLVVEVDGYAWHSDAQSFRADRQRQTRITNAGWRVLRFAAAEVFGDPRGVAEAIATALRLAS